MFYVFDKGLTVAGTWSSKPAPFQKQRFQSKREDHQSITMITICCTPPPPTHNAGDGVGGAGTSAQGAGPTCNHRVYTEEELRAVDPKLQEKVESVYGCDALHQNDAGTHLDGGIRMEEDTKWQYMYQCIVELNATGHSLISQ